MLKTLAFAAFASVLSLTAATAAEPLKVGAPVTVRFPLS
mgnify:CR=1 FL=1